MNSTANSGADRVCPGCGGIKPHGPVNVNREAKDQGQRERWNLPPLIGPACEEYLQIPTYLRWGRRLS